MPKWVSAAALAIALLSPAAAMAGDSPPEIYGDFAEDGVLSCGYSRSALKTVLSDATIHQYGDPLTMIGLKLAIRKQLAGGCRRRSQEKLSFFASPGGRDSVGGTPGSAVAPSKGPARVTTSRPKTTLGTSAERRPDEAVSTRSGRDGRMVLLGVGLLLVVLASGGWAARRALSGST